MRIKKIILKNLFSYCGLQEIEIRERTFVLAENGFGKTSLLNSIKLGLGQKDFNIESILNTHAKDKECFIEIDFDTFILKRIWDFNEDFEDLTIYINDTILKNYEAEEFLKEKFPSELIDFIFFDGEIEKDLILLKSKKIQKIFEYSFDLDILSNMIIDTKKVANNLSHEIGDREVKKFTNLQKDEIEVSKTIEEYEEKKVLIIKELKKIVELIRRNDLKIRNRSKELQNIEKEIDINELNISKEIAIFQEINLYQLPLLLNNSLLEQINTNNQNSIDILDKKVFEDSFKLFTNSLDMKVDNSSILQKFYDIFDIDNNISLSYTKKELILLLKNIKISIEKKEEFNLILGEIKEKMLKNDNFKQLEMIAIELNNQKEDKELELQKINENLENLNNRYKEIHKALRLEFIANRDKYSNMKAIEELYNISNISQDIYNLKLKENLRTFNILFTQNISPFLNLYAHIKTIYINQKFKIIIEDNKSNILDIRLLSAGQKQILSFILISTILEFKKFVDFIFIDTPFGRLSNKNRDFIFDTYYQNFSYLTLLITSSEYDYIKTKNIDFKKYIIEKDMLGSSIKEVLV